MADTAKLKFSLSVQNWAGHVTFFPLPSSNSYQKITNLAYSKKLFSKVEDNFYKNKVIVVKDPCIQLIEFDAILKGVSSSLPLKNSKYPQSLKKLIKNDKYINSKDPSIIQIAKSIKGKTTGEIIKNSYDFVLKYLDYGYPYEGLYPYSQAIRDKVTDCGGFSTMLASILNAKGIPTRLVLGFLLKNDKYTNFITKLPVKALSFENLSMHAWIEAKLSNNKWFVMDPSIEWRRNKGLTKRLGGFGNVPNDRLVVSFGEDLDLVFEGEKYKLEILQHPVSINL